MEATAIQKKRDSEKEVVTFMISMYCRRMHKSKKGTLCPECQELVNYVKKRVELCPYMATKTFCSACKTHCYKPKMRVKIKEVMRYSGPRLLFYKPWLCMRHIWIQKKSARQKQKEIA